MRKGKNIQPQQKNHYSYKKKSVLSRPSEKYDTHTAYMPMTNLRVDTYVANIVHISRNMYYVD